ncbi:MAG: O-antigen ligase family protein [Xanthomonadales bacterium]|jgi:O-antigen ligase|nr:O-antigen ligase family protein [Xanthomonadales bacterium]
MSVFHAGEGNKRQGLFFVIFCLVVLINPFPLGSNRVWAWSFEAIIVSLLLLSMVLCSLFSNKCINWSPLKRMKTELVLIGSWFVANLLYLIPLPLGLLEILSPTVAQAYKNIGVESGYLTLDLHATFSTLMLSLYYLIVFVLGTLLINSRYRIKVILTLFVILGLFEAVYGMYLVSMDKTGTLVQVTTVTPNNASGTFINKNHLVAFLSICFMSGLMLRRILNRKNSEFANSSFRIRFVRFVSDPLRLLDFCLFLILAGIWNTHSRAGLASLLLSIFFLYAFVFFTRKNKSVKFNTIIMFFALGIVFLVLVADDINYLMKILGQDTEDSVEFVVDSAQGRMLAVNQFFDNIGKYWFSGVGPGAYQVFFVNHRTVEQVAYFDHAHNDYIEFVTEYGLFSLILFAIVAVFLYRIFMFIFRSESRFYRIVGICCISSIIYMLSHGTMDFNGRIPANVFAIIVVISTIYGRIVMSKIKN